MKNQSRTIKTNLELYRVVMGGSGGYRRLPGGSDHFSWQTELHHNIYIYRHHHPNHHHIYNVFFIIRDVRRFTAMCWLPPSLSLACHLPGCLGISYLVFQIVYALFLSVLELHIISDSLFSAGFVCLFTSKTGRATLPAITCFSSITSEGISTPKVFKHNWKYLPFVEKPRRLID